MSLFETFCYLLILTSYLLNFLDAHHCAHDEINVPLTVVKDRHPKNFLKYSTADYRKINFTFDLSNLESASVEPSKKTYIVEALLPPVKNLLQSALKVIPRTSKIYAPARICMDYVKIPENASTIGYEGDMVVFVHVVREPSVAWIARALPCGLDQRTNRPIIGAVIFNAAKVGVDRRDVTLEGDLTITVHEMVHALGFTKQSYEKYINPDTLQPLTGHIFNKTVNGIKTMVLDLPPLTQRLRAHFNCPTLEGAYLENQGGNASFGSHLERRVFYNEIMTGSEIKDAKFSEFTLALLEGTGYYQVNYSYAEPMTYGKNEGCEFLDTKCVNSNTKKPAFKEFCSPLTSRGTSWTKRFMGVCGTNQPSKSSDLVPDFDYWGDKTTVLDPFADNCPQFQYVQGFDCEDTSRTAVLGYLEASGSGAKAFIGTLKQGSSPLAEPFGYCFKPKCIKKANGKYELRVMFSTDFYLTCSAAGTIRSDESRSIYDLVGTLECPDPNEFCEQMALEKSCKNSCFGNGVCDENKICQCREGWYFDNCMKRKYVDNCSRCGSDPLRTTCYGDDCICATWNTTCQCALGLKTGAECDPNSGKNNTDPNNNNNNSNIKPSSDGVMWKVVVGLLIAAIIAAALIKKKKATKLENSLSQPIVENNHGSAIVF